MVMSDSRILEVSSTSDQKSAESPQAPNHSLVHIENKPISHFSYRPPEENDPIAHALEESYLSSIVTKQKIYFILHVCSFVTFEGVYMFVFHAQCDKTP